MRLRFFSGDSQLIYLAKLLDLVETLLFLPSPSWFIVIFTNLLCQHQLAGTSSPFEGGFEDDCLKWAMWRVFISPPKFLGQFLEICAPKFLENIL